MGEGGVEEDVSAGGGLGWWVGRGEDLGEEGVAGEDGGDGAGDEGVGGEVVVCEPVSGAEGVELLQDEREGRVGVGFDVDQEN